MIHKDHLEYFKDLFEGRAAVSWRAWWKQNEARLSEELDRTDYLRLKFKMLDEAERWMKEAGVAYTPSPMARREKYFSILHESVLDEKGRPLESFQRKAYDGAIGCYMDGQPANGRATLAAFLRKLKRRPKDVRRQLWEDFCFDGEMEFTLGDQRIGRDMLELLAAMETGDELFDFAIFRARDVLKGGGQTPGV